MQGKCKKGMERMKTKAVRIHGKMDLRLEEIELPQVGPDDVQVKVISDSICMSTYKAAVEGEDHKRVPNDVAEHPTIVGHEFCGVITEVGENWKNKYKPSSPRISTRAPSWLPATPTSTAAATASIPTSPSRRC
jgi:NADPH:quinone reductase-like Zn-dependent oxidoreductase